MTKGMEVFEDKFTDADRDMLRDLQHTELPRTEKLIAQTDHGMLVKGVERREVYTFSAPLEGTWRFDVRAIKNAILDGSIQSKMYVIRETPEDFYNFVMTNNGVEPERLDKIEGRNLERPGIMVLWWPSGQSSMIDGNHRLCRRYQLKMGNFRFLSIDVRECRPFMCRPGDETRLFDMKERPGVVNLRTEVRVQGLSDVEKARLEKLGE